MKPTTTNLDELMEQDDEVFSLKASPLPERRGRPVDPASRRFNEALWRIARGDPGIGGIYHELAMITGLSPEALRSRVADIEYEPEPLEPMVGMDSDDLKYLGKAYGRLADPAVREFLQGLNGGRRRHPDREDARVKRQRITKADGTSKLISISMGISKN